MLIRPRPKQKRRRSLPPLLFSSGPKSTAVARRSEWHSIRQEESQTSLKNRLFPAAASLSLHSSLVHPSVRRCIAPLSPLSGSFFLLFFFLSLILILNEFESRALLPCSTLHLDIVRASFPPFPPRISYSGQQTPHGHQQQEPCPLALLL